MLDLPQRLNAVALAIDPALVIVDVRSARSLNDLGVTPIRITVLATAALALFAVGLAAMGIFGLIAFFVSQRTPEIACASRSARPGILRMALRQALTLAGIGLLFGSMGAIALGSVMRSPFFVNSSALDAVELAALAIAFLGVAALASWIPARRAARIDPMTALRLEA
jgi:ABC-type antimicrobial peptide transport system permease subunit